mmetsp:Transcript_27497/g.92543  ORF Transcript_27497/g.92543 Transcript_27497/m.92543 type:complete len:226 (-) Transcript_27497:755-1432(-)
MLSLASLGLKGFPVFISPSTPERSERLAKMLASDGWCQIVLPTVTPSDLQVIWDGDVGRDQPLEVREKSTQERIMVWDSPLSSVRGSGESAKSSLFGNGNGVGGAHKVANAVFHLRALQCFSTRCHECVQGDVRAAAVFEDDVQYVEGATPSGGVRHLPALLEQTFELARSTLGVNKLHLAAAAPPPITRPPSSGAPLHAPCARVGAAAAPGAQRLAEPSRAGLL